jgi:hypothetical protein
MIKMSWTTVQVILVGKDFRRQTKRHGTKDELISLKAAALSPGLPNRDIVCVNHGENFFYSRAAEHASFQQRICHNG